jgi:hypothetical protein
MIPIIRDLSPESRDLLRRQITAHFPESGIAGLYNRGRRSRTGARYIRLEIRCAMTRRNSAIAYFASDMLLIEGMPMLVAQMEKCRVEWRRNKRAERRAA